MQITLTTKLVQGRIQESSSFTATAKFFDDSTDAWSASSPSTADYRIDRIRQGDPSSYEEVLAWTTLSPASSISIAVTAAQNAIGSDCRRDERRQITVRANAGLSTQCQQTKQYSVVNLAGQSTS